MEAVEAAKALASLATLYALPASQTTFGVQRAKKRASFEALRSAVNRPAASWHITVLREITVLSVQMSATSCRVHKWEIGMSSV